MAIIVSQPLSGNTTTTVQTILNGTSQDVRGLLTSSSAILIDYTNRISLDLLRASRWLFLISEIQEFITREGVTDYWIGPIGSQPATMLDTGLNLTNIRDIKRGSVYDRSNRIWLFPGIDPPNRLSVIQEDTLPEIGRPKQYTYDPARTDILTILPAPDNQNQFAPVPNPSGVTEAVGGTLGDRTYDIRTTYVDEKGGESAVSRLWSRFMPDTQLITVLAPEIGIAETAEGVTYTGWNVYMALADGTLTKQNTSTVAFTANFTEPTTGLIAGASQPGGSTIAQLDGYMIQFRYWEKHVALAAVGDLLQIPDDYVDIMIAGVNALAFRYLLNRKDDAQLWERDYELGKREIRKDFRLKLGDQDFVRPDESVVWTSVFANLQ